MARCVQCNRVLPASGNCLYCGQLQGKAAAEAYSLRRPGSWGLWIRRAVYVAVLGGLAWFLFKTPRGQELLRDVRETYFSTNAPEAQH